MQAEDSHFKKPEILFGKGGKLPNTSIKEEVDKNDVGEHQAAVSDESCSVAKTEAAKIPYTEPEWSGTPSNSIKGYGLEVLKSGSIIDNLNLMKKPFWMFGRLNNCDICMQHPTISRYHAVLQYRSHADANNGKGFYIYDLGSTHGTFLNKNKLKPRVFVKVHVGHMLKLGCSTRTYILNGPEEDTEEESPLSVTELKEERQKELRKREEDKQALIEAEKSREELRKKKEDRGIDWGLGEDADEESDLSENPYAQTNNEDLYIDDPKKTLRGFFEREGLDLEYDCSEQGMGQFFCKVELPVDDDLGRSIFAEVIHKGKKKEAVVQCALEACRILDRHGLLRQAVHESHKRKPKNWEEDDFYDSDEDIFLDRTGTIEKKRLMRMNKTKQSQNVETYESLMEKEKATSEAIKNLEKELLEAQKKLEGSNDGSDAGLDPLDLFMTELKESKPDKQTINTIKLELSKLKQEHAKIIKLVNIAKPAAMPPLVSHYSEASTSSAASKAKALPMFGKRKKIKLQLPVKEINIESMDVDSEEEEKEEVVAEEAEENHVVTESNPEIAGNSEEATTSSASEDVDSKQKPIEKMTIEKFEKILENIKLPALEGKNREKIEKIVHNLKKMACQGDRMHADWKTLEAKKRKILKLVSYIENSEPDEKLEFKVASEMNKILNELNIMTEQKLKVINKIKKMGNELNTISDEIDSNRKQMKKPEDDVKETKNENVVAEGVVKSQKVHEDETENREYVSSENYNMWVPPENQAGDGRTQLNDKYGY